MGFCFSCCRRRPKADDQEPLLPRQVSTAGFSPPPQSQLEKVADAVAAFRAGKLPSQDQVNATLRRLLRSDVLAIEGSKSSRILGQGNQYGPLSERGKTVLGDVRELLEAVIQFGMEKNDDEILQDLIYQHYMISKTPVVVDFDIAAHAKTADEVNNLASAVPSSKELDSDARQAFHSLLTLSRLLLTSSTFRILLSDFMLTSRALLADVATDVGRIARTIELKAEAVEETVRPADKDVDPFVDNIEGTNNGTGGELREVESETRDEWAKISKESPDRIKETVLGRLTKVLSQAQRTPAYHSALKGLLSLLRKYVERVTTVTSAVSSIPSSTVSVTPIIIADSALTRVLTDFRIIIERLASGRSLSPCLSYLETTIRGIISTSSPTSKGDLLQYLDDVGSWLDRALARPGFSTSMEGHRWAERLYDRGRSIIQSESKSPWTRDAHNFMTEADAFTHALTADRTMHRVLDALDKFSNHTNEFGRAAIGASIEGKKVWRKEVERDLIGWVLPRVLRMLKSIPLPRVELKSPSVDVAVDSLLLTAASASFVPDHMLLQNWSEVRVEASAALLDPSGGGWSDTNQGGVTTSTRTRFRVDGLRISAHRIGYYVRYKGPLSFLGWEDNGLLSLDVGRHDKPGEGLSIDIDVETTPERLEADGPIFHVNDVQVNIPGLRLSIDNSRHWIFNKLFLQPLAGPTIKHFLGNILASHIRTALEGLSETLSLIHKKANERTKPTEDVGPSLEDYLNALFATIGASSSEEAEENTPEQLVETETRVTLKGVVHGVHTQAEPESSDPPTPLHTAIAVGIGEQILPGKGGPKDLGSVVGQAREALEELEASAGTAVGKAKAVGDNTVERATQVRDDLEEASARMEARENFEKRRRGWKSRAFDF